MRAEFAIAWYFHLPAVASPIEVRDHAEGSLELLLRHHEETGTPVMVAPTGSFLQLCSAHAPRSLSRLATCVRAGIVTLAATWFYETDPISVSWQSLRFHLESDIQLKTELFGRSPEWFLPGNFIWRPGLELLLAEHDLAGVVLDSRHYAATTRVREWQWDSDAVGSVAVVDHELPVAQWETRSPRRLRDSGLTIVFRDWDATRALTFGSDGAMHRRDYEPRIAEQIAAADSPTRSLVVLVDDGDRLTGSTSAAYRHLIDTAGALRPWPDLLDWPPTSPSLRELPAFTPAGMANFLRHSEDATYYWAAVRELELLSDDGGFTRELLELQDVFYVFWPGAGRRVWYADQIAHLSNRAAPPTGGTTP